MLGDVSRHADQVTATHLLDLHRRTERTPIIVFVSMRFNPILGFRWNDLGLPHIDDTRHSSPSSAQLASDLPCSASEPARIGGLPRPATRRQRTTHAVQPARRDRLAPRSRLVRRAWTIRYPHRAMRPTVRRGCRSIAGDGIKDVQATERDRDCLVSLLRRGWCSATAPLGRSGLACFDQDGRPVDCSPRRSAGHRVLRSMADCYALNVCSDRETWLYFYTGFRTRAIHGCAKLRRLATCRSRGSHAFAVVQGAGADGRQLRPRRNSLFLGQLDTLEFEELTPVDRKGQPLQKFQAFGRRDHLFLATNELLHVANLERVVIHDGMPSLTAGSPSAAPAPAGRCPRTIRRRQS